MSSVDNRIVNMHFNNKDFQAGAADSIQSLNELEATVADMGSGSGLTEMGASVDQVSTRFGALQIAGVTALATIVSQATSAAISIGGNLLGAIKSSVFDTGLSRALDIQQARFQLKGLGLDVEQVMSDANSAVDGTAYALNEAASLAAQFGGAGVKAGQDMEEALRATAGIAAQTGARFSEIGYIMSGIAATGRLNGQDLLQFSTRNLDVTEQLAESLGRTQDQIRAMVSAGEIDFETFSAVMDEHFGKNAQKASRTFTGALANMKTALTRIGGDFWKGQLDPLRDIFNGLQRVFVKVQAVMAPVSKGLHRMSAAISETVVGFLDSIKVAKLLTPIVQGFRNIFAPFLAIAKAVGEAWTEVFPQKQNQGRKVIYSIADAFEFLTKPLGWIAEQIPKITPVLEILFTLMKAGVGIVGALARGIGDLVSKGSDIGSGVISGILEGFNADSIRESIEKLGNDIITWIKGVLGINSPAETMIPIGEAVVEGIAEGIVNAIKFIFNAMATIGGALVDGFKQLFGDMDALDWTALFNALLTGGLLFTLIKMAKAITGFIEGFGETLSAIGNPIGSLTDALKEMQNNVKPPILIQIAIAVGTLTASLIALSLIPKDKLTRGTVALAGVMALMLGTVKILSIIEPQQIFAASGALILIASAMVVMAGAVAAFGQINPEKLGQGLTTMTISLALMIGAVEYLGALGPMALAGAGGIFIVSAAMVALAAAVAAFGQINPEKVGLGLTTMAIALTLMVGAIEYLGKVGPYAIAGAGAIFVVSAAMVVLAAAVAAFGKINPEKVGQGLTTMALALALMVGAISYLGALGPAALAAAGGLFIVSAAMVVVAGVLKLLGGIKQAKITKALYAMAIALGIFLVAAALAGIPVVAAGLLALGEAMLRFGAGVALFGAGLLFAATAMSLLAGITAAGVATMVAALTALMNLLPVFALQLANAIVVFTMAIAAAAPELREAIGEIIKGMLGTIRDAWPEFAKTFNKIISSLVKIVRNNHKEVGKIFTTLIETGLRVIRKTVPDFVDTGLAIVLAFMRGIRRDMDEIIDLGVDIIIKFIKGVEDGAGDIVTAAGDSMLVFLHKIERWTDKNIEEFVEVGIQIGKNIVKGLAKGLADSVGLGLVWDAVGDIVDGVTTRLAGVKGFKEESPSKLAYYWGEMLVAGLALGIRDNIKYAVGETIRLANAVISAGDKKVRKAQKEATKKQIAADNVTAKALVANKLAREAEKLARQSPKNKALAKAAKDARKRADEIAKDASKLQKAADAAVNRVSNVKEFRSADDQGKGDILTQQAKNLSDRARKALAKANAEALAAKKLSGEARKDMLEAARKDAKAAKDLADRSKAASKRADEFYTKSVRSRIKSIIDERKAEKKAQRKQEEYDNASAAEKIDILKARADAAQKRSDAAREEAKALLKKAREVAKKDAARAQKLLDRSERLANKAEKQAEEAKEYTEQAAGGTSTTGPTLQLSASALEDAASAIDRYTESLQQAEEAAAAATPVYQFVQNNTSPVALTDTEIYRQSKNLLSTAEIKMVV